MTKPTDPPTEQQGEMVLPPLNIDAEIAGKSVAIMESPDYEWREGDFLRRALCRERQLLQALRELAAAREQIARLETEKAQTFNDGRYQGIQEWT